MASRELWKTNKRDSDDPAELLTSPLVIADRFSPARTSLKRLAEAFEQAYLLGNNVATFIPRNGDPLYFTRDNRCPIHGQVLPAELTPRHFSFNTRLGACPECDGIGRRSEIDVDKLFPESELSLWEAMHGWARVSIKKQAQ